MSHTATFDQEQGLVIVTFGGEITFEEEMQAFLEVVSDPRMVRDARILVDKSRSRMKVGAEHVVPQLEAVAEQGDTLGRMRIAHVVTDDRDYGMLRMLEQRSEARLPHELAVFRSVDEALGWLRSGSGPEDNG